MNITKNNKKFLKNYKVPNFLIDDVYLNFVLLPTKTLVKSKIKFRVNPKAENTNFYLHGELIVKRFIQILQKKIN